MTTTQLLLWLPAIALSALATIDGEYRGRRRQVYVCKPLTTALILLGALIADGGGTYRWLIVAGLVFSLAGDVFLMLPRDRFREGLVSFAVAHLLYIGAFAGGWAWTGVPATAWLVLLAVWAAFSAVLLPGARGLRVPVAVYGALLLLMAGAAIGRADALGGPAWWAAVGAVLFAFSDAVIGWNKFLRPFRAAQALILGSYFPAQALIVLSI